MNFDVFLVVWFICSCKTLPFNDRDVIYWQNLKCTVQRFEASIGLSAQMRQKSCVYSNTKSQQKMLPISIYSNCYLKNLFQSFATGRCQVGLTFIHNDFIAYRVLRFDLMLSNETTRENDGKKCADLSKVSNRASEMPSILYNKLNGDTGNGYP